MSGPRNKLTDLNNLLFEQMERLLDDDLTDEELEREIRRSEAVTKTAGTIISNANLAFQTMKHLNEYGYGGGAVPVPEMLNGGNASNKQITATLSDGKK